MKIHLLAITSAALLITGCSNEPDDDYALTQTSEPTPPPVNSPGPLMTDQDAGIEADQTASFNTSTNKSDAGTPGLAAQGQSAEPSKGSDLIGKKVVNQQQEELGEIRDLAMDMQTGEITHAALATGGVLGVGEEWIAVPIEALEQQGKDKPLILETTQEQLEQAPKINKENWAEAAKSKAWGANLSVESPEPLGRDGAGAEPQEDYINSQPQNRNQSQPEQPRSLQELRNQPDSSQPQASQQQRARLQANRASAEQSANLRSENAEVKESTQIELNEETLSVDVKETTAGGVILRTEVTTEQVEKPVELKREEIVIERLSPEEAKQAQTAQSGAPSAQGEAFAEQEIFIPLHEEKAVVSKETEVREIVRVSTQTLTEQDTVQATLRSEELKVERVGQNPQAQSGSSTEQGESSANQAQQDQPQNKELKRKIEQNLKKQEQGQASINEQQLKQIQMQINNGTVTLQGKVQSEQLKKQIEEKVKKTEGVKKVENKLEVQNPGANSQQ